MKTGRRIMMVFMAMVLVLSGVVAGDLKVAVAEEKSVFSDVPLNHQYYEAIKWVKSRGVNGYGDGTFKPDRQITKFELVQMHYALFGKEWFSMKDVETVRKGTSFRVLNAPKGNWRYMLSHYALADLGKLGFFEKPTLSDKYVDYGGNPFELGSNLNFNEGLTEEALTYALNGFVYGRYEYDDWYFARDSENGWAKVERIAKIIEDNPNFKITRNAEGKEDMGYGTEMLFGYYALAGFGLKSLPLTEENMQPARPITRGEMAHILMLMEKQCNEHNTTRAEMGKRHFKTMIEGDVFWEQPIANPD